MLLGKRTSTSSGNLWGKCYYLSNYLVPLSLKFLEWECSHPLKEITIIFISDVAVSNSALQDLFFFGINYHGKINGCNFTKLTGMKSKIEKKAILNKHENNYTSKVEKRLIVTDFLSLFSLTQR